MSVAQKYADIAAKNYAKEIGGNKALDPATIGVFIELIFGFIQMFKQCKQNPTDGALIANSPSLLQKVRAKAFVRKELGGRKAFRQLDGAKLTEALLDAGKNMTSDEMADLYEEAADSDY